MVDTVLDRYKAERHRIIVDMLDKINLDDCFWEDKTSLVGKDDANVILKHLKKLKVDFEDLENKHTEIQILIPDNIVTMSYTFFNTLFGEHVVRLGKLKFKNKYKFKTSKHIQDNIVEFIDKKIFLWNSYEATEEYYGIDVETISPQVKADREFFDSIEEVIKNKEKLDRFKTKSELDGVTTLSINQSKPLTERDRRYSYFIEKIHKCIGDFCNEMTPDALELCENKIRDMMFNVCKHEAIDFATKVMYMKDNNKTDMKSDIPSIAYETVEEYYDKLYK